MIILAPSGVIVEPTTALDLGGPRVQAGPDVAPLRWEWSAPWLDRSWNLTDPAGPVVKLKGATGAGHAPVTHWWAESPTVDGSSHHGGRTERGSVFLPVMVQASDSASFMAEHSAFMRSLDPRREGLVRVIRPDGEWREIGCRYESGADLAIDLDPVALHHARYGITWATADPFWRGEPVTNRYTLSTGGSIFPGPPFVIGRGLNLSDANVTNPGDVDAFPVYRVVGPFSAFTVGVGDSVVSMTLAKGEGQWVEVDMTPDRLTVVDESGVDRWDNLNDVGFAAIPPGRTTLTTSLVGAGPSSAVEVVFTPRYRGAW